MFLWFCRCGVHLERKQRKLSTRVNAIRYEVINNNILLLAIRYQIQILLNISILGNTQMSSYERHETNLNHDYDVLRRVWPPEWKEVGVTVEDRISILNNPSIQKGLFMNLWISKIDHRITKQVSLVGPSTQERVILEIHLSIFPIY